MFLRWFSSTFALLLVCAGALFPIDPLDGFRDRAFFLDFAYEADTPAPPTIYLDSGNGFSEAERIDEAIEKYANRPRYALPKVTLAGIRIDPPPGTRHFTIDSPFIFDSHGLIHRQPDFAKAAFSEAIASKSVVENARKLTAEVESGQIDPFVSIPLEAPLALEDGWRLRHSFRGALAAVPLASVLALTLSLVMAFRLFNWPSLLAFLRSSPSRTIALASLAALCLSCAPVLFFGKSFVSPNFDEQIFQSHQDNPTLPNLLLPSSTSMHGSDLGATAWIHKPYSDIQAEAVFTHGEFPLWNRYNLQGAPLLGQGQSMIFDPLHWPTILTWGNSAAWDAKYLIGRFLFCFATGSIVFTLWSRLSAATLIAFASAFLGFYYFRFNHPAHFGFCYMPLILWAWTLFVRGSHARSWAGATWLLLAGNALTLASGTIKEAYMYVLCMNIAGVALLALSSRERSPLFSKRLKWALGATALSVLATAPIWLIFIDAFFKASHIYNEPHADQLSLRWLAGLFDDIFLRQLHPDENLFSVSANWIVLAGLCGIAATGRGIWPDRHAIAIVLASLFPFALAFGIVPASFLESLPLIQGFHHVHDIFAAPLVTLLLVLAGYGFSRLHDTPRIAAPLVAYAVAVASLLFLFASQGKASDDASRFFGYSHFALAYISMIIVGGALVIVGWKGAFSGSTAGRISRLLLAIGLLFGLWRYAQNHFPILKNYTMRPPERVDTNPPTYAIERMKALAGDEPYRAAGVVASLFTGYSGSVGVEGTGGGDSIFPPFHQELTRGLGFEYRWGWRLFHHPRDISQQHAALDFLNTRYFVSKAGLPEPEFTRLIHDDQSIYASETAWPRAFFTNRILTYTTLPELRSLVESKQAQPFAAVSPETKAKLVLGSIDASAVSLPASDYQLTSNTTQFALDAPAPGLAVLHESFWPGDFKATVNGEPAKVLRVNHSFKAVQLPAAGQYVVRFAYDPPSWRYSLYLAAIGFTLLVAVNIRVRRPRVGRRVISH